MSKTYKKIINSIFYSILLIVGILLIYFFITFKEDSIILERGIITKINDGWYEVDGSTEKAIKSFPFSKKLRNNYIEIFAILPDVGDYDYLSIETNYQSIKAYVDGELVYSEDDENLKVFGDKIKLAIHNIALNKSMSGKKISIKTEDVVNFQDVTFNNVFIGNKSSLTLFFVIRSVPSLFIGILITILGVIFLFSSIFIRIKKTSLNSRAFLYLSFFACLVGLWIITNIKFLQVFYFKKTFFYLLSSFTLLLIPIPLLLFFRDICKKNNVIINVAIITFEINVVLQIVLGALTPIKISNMLIGTHVLIGISSLLILTISIREYYKGNNKDLTHFISGLCLVAFCAILCIIQYYITPISALVDDELFFLKIGLFVFILLLGLGIFEKSVEIVKVQTESLMYKKMAYTDMMTNLNNRASFEEKINNIEVDNRCSITIIEFDIDDLKVMNDTNGHDAGDELIIGISECMKAVFSEIGSCYRIGGDEFVVILEGYEESAILNRIHLFNETIKKYRTKSGYELHVSSGYAYDDMFYNHYKAINEIINEADRLMYENKAKHKKNRCD